MPKKFIYFVGQVSRKLNRISKPVAAEEKSIDINKYKVDLETCSKKDEVNALNGTGDKINTCLRNLIKEAADKNNQENLEQEQKKDENKGGETDNNKPAVKPEGNNDASEPKKEKPNGNTQNSDPKKEKPNGNTQNSDPKKEKPNGK